MEFICKLLSWRIFCNQDAQSTLLPISSQSTWDFAVEGLRTVNGRSPTFENASSKT